MKMKKVMKALVLLAGYLLVGVALLLCWLCRAERSCPDQGKGRAGHADECGVSAV